MSDKPDLPGKNDLPIAYRAICLADGLSGDAKKIAAIIIGHFNVRTGQCDPGTERLMSKSGASRRSVVNATNELHRLGLVVKVRHGGNGFRSRYQPKWEAFNALIRQFEGDETETYIVQEPAHTKCKSLHIHSASSCTLTQSRNSTKKLNDADGASGRGDDHPSSKPVRTVSAETVQGLLRDSLRHRPAIKRQLPSVVAAQEAARHRIECEIGKLGETIRSVIDQRMTPEIESAAIVAELKTQGSGVHMVIERVSQMPGKAGGA